MFFLLIKKYKSPNEFVLFLAHFDTSKLSIPVSFFLGDFRGVWGTHPGVFEIIVIPSPSHIKRNLGFQAYCVGTVKTLIVHLRKRTLLGIYEAYVVRLWRSNFPPIPIR